MSRLVATGTGAERIVQKAAALDVAGDSLQEICSRAGLAASGPFQMRCLKRNGFTAVTTAAIIEPATGQSIAVVKLAERFNPVALRALGRETACLKALARSGLHAPRLLAFAGAGSVLLRSWEAGGPRRKTLSLAHVSALASLLAKVHRIQPRAGTGTLPIMSLADRIASCEKNLTTLASVHRSRLWSHGRQLRRLRPSDRPIGLIHGDISMDNIVAGPGAEVILIDWAEGAFGPVMLDLGAVINTVARDSRRLTAFLSRYDASFASLPDLMWFAALDSWTRCVNAASNGRSYQQTMRRLESQLAKAASPWTAKSPNARKPASLT